MPRTLEYMRLEDLRPDPRNPKDHQLEDLRESTGRFGYTEPVMIDERTGMLVSGHGRQALLLADHEAGSEPPNGVEVDADGAWRVPVIRGWASTDDDEALAYVIAANRLPEVGGWNPGKLLDALDGLAERGRGLLGLGYTADELDDLLAGLGGSVLPVAETAASFAEHTETEAAAQGSTKQAQGLHEVGLVFQAGDFREYEALLVGLKHQWGQDSAPEVVLRSLREAVG